MSQSTVAVTSENFNEVVLNSEKPVIVDFWAAWCQPCLMIGPILEEIADEYAEKVTIAKLDVDDPSNMELAAKYQITSIPAIKVFVGGEVAHEIVGSRPKAAFLNEFAEYLN